VDACVPAAEAKRVFDREFQEFKVVLTGLGMAN